jgi:hypothetical protein
MRHFVVAAVMLLGALAITFGAASILQDVARARVSSPAKPFKVEAAAPVTKSFGIQ